MSVCKKNKTQYLALFLVFVHKCVIWLSFSKGKFVSFMDLKCFKFKVHTSVIKMKFHFKECCLQSSKFFFLASLFNEYCLGCVVWLVFWVNWSWKADISFFSFSLLFRATKPCYLCFCPLCPPCSLHVISENLFLL